MKSACLAHVHDSDPGSYLRKALVHEHVQQSSKQLVAHEDSEEEIAKNEGTGVSPGICPEVDCCKEETDAVQSCDEDVELPARASVRDSKSTPLQVGSSPICVEP